MADVNQSESKPQVKNSTVDQVTEMIPPGDEHNRCREALISEAVGMNILGADGLTPLMFAAREDHPQCVKELIKAGADVDITTYNGATGLIHAVAANHVQCVNELIKAGADVNISDDDDRTPLIHAVTESHIQCVNELIKAGANVNMRDKVGFTPLNRAAHWSREACLKLLIEAGADLNIPQQDGWTPLIFAVIGNNVQYVNELIKAGADVNITDEDGLTPLMLAVREDHVQCVKELINVGADVNILDEDGLTPLMFALKEDHVQCVKELIKAGADVNTPDKDGKTPLMLAVDKNCADYEYSWDMETYHRGWAEDPPEYRSSPLISDVEEYRMQCVTDLIKAGADVNKYKGRDGRKPLLNFVAESGSEECLKILIDAGADVNITDYDGSTVLHFWLNRNYLRNEKNCLQCIKRLLRAGIRINIPKGWLCIIGGRGETALQLLLDYKNIYKDDDPKTEIYKKHVYLLYAAGETLDGTEGKKIPEELKFEEEKLKLKHICREAIRKHLLKLDRHANLFVRAPDLGLPRILTEYMLYDQSLDKDNDDGDSDNDDDDVDDNIEED